MTVADGPGSPIRLTASAPGLPHGATSRQGQRAALSDLFSSRGRRPLVTGGSRGIGLMIARGFVEAGRHASTSRPARTTCATRSPPSSRRSATCVSLPADLATEAACTHSPPRSPSARASSHILVNNAGATWGAPLAEYPADAWDKVLDLNVKAPFFLTRALLPLLESRGHADDPARVINIGSIDGIQVPMLETYSYSSSKAAVHQLTRHLAAQPRRRSTSPSTRSRPGPFESKMMAATLRDFGDRSRSRRRSTASAAPTTWPAPRSSSRAAPART